MEIVPNFNLKNLSQKLDYSYRRNQLELKICSLNESICSLNKSNLF